MTRAASTPRAMVATAAVLLLLGTTALLSACGESASGTTGGRLKVVTTVSPITNIVANVAGGRADVEGIVPEGANSHEFEPAPKIAKTLAEADLVFLNGLSLEEPTKKLAEANLRDGAEIVELGARTISKQQYIYDFSFPREKGDPNPHLWTNPLYARGYAQVVQQALSRRDPANSAAYARNYRAYARQVDGFDRALRAATDTVAVDRRRLVTYHDSFPYFAREYGWKVVGAIQPSDFSDPTPKEVAGLIAQVRDQGVPAIFGSEVFPSPVLGQIAKESGARYVDDLRDDDLPEGAGDAGHSLIGLLRFDYTTIIRALGGDPAALARFDAGNPVGGEARYAG